MSIRRFKFIIRLIIPILGFFLMSQNVFADSLSTASLDLYYIPVSASNYIWRTGMLYNQSQQLWQAKKYQFNTPSVTATGTNAVIHFETNIVASQPANSSGINQSHYVNLDYMTNLSCSASNGNLSIIGSSLSYARTPWFSNNNFVFNETLTLYGDIALKGFNKDTSGTITCAVGSDDYAFYNSGSQISTDYSMYFEQNPMTIIWTDNNTDNLLQQQISQTQQLIYQNQQLYEQNNQNTQDIINNQNQNTQDIIKSNQKCAKFDKTFSSSNITNSAHYLNSNGSLVSNGGWGVIEYIPFYAGLTYEVTLSGSGSSPSLCQYDAGKNLISCSAYSGNYSLTFNASSNAKYLSLSIADNSSARIRVISDQEVCKNINEEYYDEQRQADQNISNQTSSDIDGATNQQTTNLIGTISSFVSALSSINTNGSCQLTLPFPNLLGGSQTVNPCTGADKAPTIVAAASSLLLITVFIPLAFILVKMIYNEIRSFTNG